MNRRDVVLLFSLLLPLAACEPSVAGNGDPAMEARSLEGFIGVECDGSFDVRVERGGSFDVTVHIDSNLLPLVQTWVSGGALHIGSDRHLATRIPGPHVTVRMPEVTNATLSGSGKMAVVGMAGTRPLSLRLSGSGNVDFDGTAPSIGVDLDGSGDVNLAGSTDHVRLDLSGSGSIDAANLVATSGSIDLGGSGSVRATINGPVDATLRGSGEIDLYGNVVLQHSSKSGSGDIRVH